MLSNLFIAIFIELALNKNVAAVENEQQPHLGDEEKSIFIHYDNILSNCLSINNVYLKLFFIKNSSDYEI